MCESSEEWNGAFRKTQLVDDDTRAIRIGYACNVPVDDEEFADSNFKISDVVDVGYRFREILANLRDVEHAFDTPDNWPHC